MALPASETFTSGVNQALTSYSASWTVASGGFQTNTDGVCYSTTGVTCYARWNADAFNADHYSEVVLATGFTGSSFPGVAAGVQSSGASGYYYIVASGGTNEFGRTNSGSDTIIDATITQVWAVGDVLRMEKSHPNGTTTRIVVKRAPAATSTVFTTLLTYDDTSGSRLSGGSAGLAGYGANVGVSGVTSWSGGNLGSGSQDLVGGATGGGTASGAATVTKPLAGGVVGQGTATGAAAVSKPLAGGATGQGAATGAASVAGALGGGATGGATAAADAAVGKPLAGAAAGQASAAGTLLDGATITTAAFKNDSGTLLAGLTIAKLCALKVSDLSLAASWTNQTTNGSGVLALTSEGLVGGTAYLLVSCSADGSAHGAELYTAA